MDNRGSGSLLQVGDGVVGVVPTCANWPYILAHSTCVLVVKKVCIAKTRLDLELLSGGM